MEKRAILHLNSDMKKTSLILAVDIASACSGGVGNPSVEDTLRQAAESGTPLFGHQDDLMYGHTWNATKDNDTDLTRSDVLSVAGSYPCILGLDLGGLEIDSPVNQYNDLWKMTYNHMVNEKKLEGMLWAISPNSLSDNFEIWENRYPGDEYIGDVMNVLFSSGWIEDSDGKVFIYYASSDTRMHVATSSIERLVDYCMNTEPDGLRTGLTVE